MNKKILTIGLVVIVVMVGFLAYSYTERFTNTKEDELKPYDSSNTSKNEVVKDINDNDIAYVDYSEKTFESNADKRRVLFFHAKWCPTCKVADSDITQNLSKIPSDVVVYKTDYDTENQLKSKYGITYQHTFVLVDSQGNEILKWNGGGINEILSKLEQ